MTIEAEQAPPGIECHFVDIWQTRPIIHPRMLLIHTNAASVESTLQAQLNWANAAHDNTKPHYVVDRRGVAWKTLPSNRQGIANYKADAFGLSIETTDLGYPNPGGAVGFTPAQAETVAVIVAWESELWDFPIATPKAWDGTGVAAHTDPFTYPYWTKYQGKTCPGDTKKHEVRSIILPRALQLRNGDDEMKAIDPTPVYDTRQSQGGNGPRRPEDGPITIPIPGASTECTLKVEAISPQGGGFLAIGRGDLSTTPAVAAVNFEPNGQTVAAQISYPTRTDANGAIKLWVVGAPVEFRLSVLATG